MLDILDNVWYTDNINYWRLFFKKNMLPKLQYKKGDKMLLGDVAEVRTGLVLSRKKAQNNDETKFKYNALNLRCAVSEGYLDLDDAEEYYSTEPLKSEYLTREKDILVRLSAPYTVVFITSLKQCGYVIPSHFAIVRSDKTKAAPEYLNWFLKRDAVKQKIIQNVSGSTAFGTISSGFIDNLKIRDIPISEQKTLGNMLLLAEKEQELLHKLAAAKALYSKAIVNKIYDRIKRGNENDK